MFRRYNANDIRQNEDARANDANIERCRKEACNIAKKQEESKDLEGDLPKAESEDVKVELPEGDVFNDSNSAGAELLNKATSTDQIGKSNSGAEKVSLPDLGKKMEAQVEALQKFVVKQERVLFQLNPEKLGTLTVFMKTWRSN